MQLENEEIKKFKVDELRAELTKRGLSKNGLKLDLQEILYKAMDYGVVCIKTATTSAAPTVFHNNARWHFIYSKDLPDLLDPVNETFETAYAPSDRKGPAGARKFNYQEAWERDNSENFTKQPSKDAAGNLMVDASGKVKYSLQPVTKLTCNYYYIKNHKLTLESTPSDWIRPFFPAMKPKGSGKY